MRGSDGSALSAQAKPVSLSPDYIHELGFYGADSEFAALIRPFAFGGLARDEPVVFAYDEPKVALLREWLPDSPNITYITDTGPYATPAKAIGAWRDVVQTRLAAGAPRVRIAGDVPHEGYGRPYAGWDRYEAAVDRALGDLPVWAPCLYDLRVTPPDVVDTATRLHRGFLEPDCGHRTNEGFAGPGRLADFRRPPSDGLEESPPAATLVNPTPSAARAALRSLSHGRADAETTDALMLGLTEALSNAYIHGRSPVEVRIWVDGQRVLVDVSDAGQGPEDPLVGLLPENSDAESGRGLWIVHNLDIDVALLPDSERFTVRLCAGGDSSA